MIIEILNKWKESYMALDSFMQLLITIGVAVLAFGAIALLWSVIGNIGIVLISMAGGAALHKYRNEIKDKFMAE